MLTFSPKSFWKYFSNTSWLLGERVARLIIHFLVGIYVARYLGPSDYGVLNYAISFVAVFSMIATFGMDEVVIKDLVRRPEEKDAILGTAFGLKLLGSFAVFLFIFLVLRLAGSDASIDRLIFIIAFGLVFQSFNVIDLYFQSQVLSKHVVQALFFKNVLISALKVVLILNKASLFWFAVVLLAENIVLAAALLVKYLHQKLSFSLWQFHPALAKRFIVRSFPLALSLISISIYMRIDQIMIKSILSTNAVGNYAVVVHICEIWHFIPLVITGSLFPSILASKRRHPAIYEDRLQKLYDLMFLLSFAIALSLTLFGKTAVLLLLGQRYAPAADLVGLYAWANVPVFIGIASRKWLISENLQWYEFYRTFGGCVINIMLNLLLIPRFGLRGAACTTLVSYMVSVFSILLFARTRENAVMMIRSFFPWKRKLFSFRQLPESDL